jgi:hypothetical protein
MSHYDWWKVETGDIILMSSITTFSVIVRWSNATDFNHCSIAVRIDENKLPEVKIVKTGGTLCAIEFNGDDYKNVLTGEIHHGNRLVVLNDMLSKYKRISVRKLKNEHYTEGFVERAKNFILKYCKHKVKIDMLTPALNSVFGLELKDDNSDQHPVFCSELTSKFYGDIINGSIKTNYKNLLPHHFVGSKYNHLFDSDVIDIKNEPHDVMDFMQSWVFLIILLLILIIIFILFVLIGRRVYVRYVIKK